MSARARPATDVATYLRQWLGVEDDDVRRQEIAVSALSEFLWQVRAGRTIDAIAEQAGRSGYSINRATVARYLAGEHGPRPAETTLLALAAGLDVDVRLLRRCIGAPSGELGPYRPVAESARLSQAQRAAIDQLIKSIVGRPDAAFLGTAGADQPAALDREPELSGVLQPSPGKNAAEAFGGDVYVGEPASAELRD